MMLVVGCTTQFNKNDQASQRNVSSVSALGLNQAEMYNFEMNYAAFAGKPGAIPYDVAVQKYKYKLNQFNQIIENTSLPTNQKRAQLQSLVKFAEVNINHQTDENSYIRQFLLSRLNTIKTNVNNNNFKQAQDVSLTMADWILSIAVAMQ